MDFSTIFFILLTLIVISYIIFTFKSNKRFHLVSEIFFILIYIVILVLVIFPNLLKKIEEVFGIQSAINFIVYFSIFVAYFLIFIFYTKTEEQRIEITKLAREIAYLKNDKKKKR